MRRGWTIARRTGALLLALLLAFGLLPLGAAAYATGGSGQISIMSDAEETPDNAVLIVPAPEEDAPAVVIVSPAEPSPAQGGVVVVGPSEGQGAAGTASDGQAVIVIGTEGQEDGEALPELSGQGGSMLLTEQAVKVTIRFSAGDGSGTMDWVSVDKGASFTLPKCEFTPPPEQDSKPFVFIGWKIGDKLMAPGSVITPEADTTLIAQWAIKEQASYALSWVGATYDIKDELSDAEGGTAAFQEPHTSGAAKKGDTVKIKPAAAKGYAVKGVELIGSSDPVTKGDDGVWSFTMPEAPVTVRVSFEAEKATVSFNPGEGSGTMASVMAHKNIENGYTLPGCTFTPPTTDMAFKAWKVGEQELQPEDKITVTGDLTITALWKAAPKTYNITLVINTQNASGSSTAVSTAGVDTELKAVGGTLRVNTCKAAENELVQITAVQPNQGYARHGDIVVSAGTPASGGFRMPDKDVTVTVTFKLSRVTVIFDANGHGKAPAAQELDWGTRATRPKDPTAAGYVFQNWWYKDAQGVLHRYTFNEPVTENIVLYAEWRQKVEYTVTKNATGEWIKHSGKNHEIIVKRSVDDKHAIDYFEWVSIDGVVLTERTDYTVEAGSVVLRLKPGYLDELKRGEHRICIQFSDGEAYASLKVYPPRKGVPTGDVNDAGFWAGMLMLSFAACTLGAVTLIGSRSRRRS